MVWPDDVRKSVSQSYTRLPDWVTWVMCWPAVIGCTPWAKLHRCALLGFPSLCKCHFKQYTKSQKLNKPNQFHKRVFETESQLKSQCPFVFSTLKKKKKGLTFPNVSSLNGLSTLKKSPFRLETFENVKPFSVCWRQMGNWLFDSLSCVPLACNSWLLFNTRHSHFFELKVLTALHQSWHAALGAAMAIVLDGHLCIWSRPVTMHDDQGPVEKEGCDGGSLKLLTWPFGRWTIDSSLPQATACFRGHSPKTGERKLKNRKFFYGVVGLDGRCSVQAEQRKKPVAVGPLPGAYLLTETNFVSIRGVTRKEFDTGHTRTHARTPLNRRRPPGPRR